MANGDTYSYQFGVSEFTTWPWTFEQDVDHYANLGVAAMEVCEFKLDGARVADQLRLVTERGLRISSAQPSIRTLFPSRSQPEPKEVPARMARFRGTIDRFSDHARGVPFVTNTGIPPGGNIQHVMDVGIEQYRELSNFASDRGARIALEPLNPSIMNVESAIWTLDQAMTVVEAVDRSNFGICLDFWNVWQNPRVDEAIRACGDRIFVVQVSDWRTPRSDQDRLIPGQGRIPLGDLVLATREAGFTGAYSVEIFSGNIDDSLWQGDLAEVIRSSRLGMDGAWREALEMARKPSGSVH